MKTRLLTGLIFLICLPALSKSTPAELPIGAELSTRLGFWVYEIKGRLPYGGNTHYIMTSSKGRGIGDGKYRYVARLPAETQLEVIGLIKKNRRQWFYIVRIKDYDKIRLNLIKDTPSLKGASIVISSYSMLKVPEGKMWLGDDPLYIWSTQLHPDLFTDFIYPTE